MNPPWERIKLQEKEWFAARSPDIASAPNAAARKRMITALQAEDPALWQAFQDDVRGAESESHFIRNSGKYPLCGRGDVNTYAVFAELVRQVLSPTGCIGIIVPTGIAIDDSTQQYFKDLVETGTLKSLFSFENEERVFPGVHHSFRFCLMTIVGRQAKSSSTVYAFYLRNPEHLLDSTSKFELTADDIRRINPNSGTAATFRSEKDAELTRSIYRNVPVLLNRSLATTQIQTGFYRMFDMGSASPIFKSASELSTSGYQHQGNEYTRFSERILPFYEGKMVDAYNHRYCSVITNESASLRQSLQLEHSSNDWNNPDFRNQPLFWVPLEFLREPFDRIGYPYALVYKRVTMASSERTVKACIVPKSAISDKIPVIIADSPQRVSLLLTNLNAFVLDYVARQKTGYVNLAQFAVEQLPVLNDEMSSMPPDWTDCTSVAEWLIPRALELTYTAWDLQPFARDCGYDGPPFRWDEDRRFLLRCELDAAYFHLYGIERDDVDYIMETFPIVKRKDIARHGEYRTKRVILEMYDDMAVAIQGGASYVTRLDPPPAHPQVAHENHQQAVTQIGDVNHG